MRNLRGSYHWGFSPRDYRPRYHTLWKGCKCAVAPCLGPTGAQGLDWTPYKNHGALTNFTIANAWVVDSGQYAIQQATGSPGTFLDCGRQQWIEGASIVSVSVWFRRPSAGATLLIGKGTAGDANNQFDVEIFSDGMVYLEPTSTAAGQGFGSFVSNDTSWHHVAWVFDGTKSSNSTRMRGWLDGVEQTILYAGTVGATVTNPTGNLSIGRVQTGTTRYSTGLFDDYRIYDRVLNPNEIVTLSRRRGIAYEAEWQEFATDALPTLSLSVGMGVNAAFADQLVATVLFALTFPGAATLANSQTAGIITALGLGATGGMVGNQVPNAAQIYNLVSDAQIQYAANLIVEKAIQLIVGGYQGQDFAAVQLVAQAMLAAAGLDVNAPPPPPIGKMWFDAVQSNFSGTEAVQSNFSGFDAVQ